MCVRPYKVRYDNCYGLPELASVPCGKCIECVIAKQNSWKIRLIEESKDWKYAYFFTLTYRESALKYHCINEVDETVVGVTRGRFKKDVNEALLLRSTACKKDVQRWLMRFRTSHVRRVAGSLGYSVRDVTSDHELYECLKARFSYFICAEYGPNGTNRPHYHGLIFTDLSPQAMYYLFADWRKNYGFVKMSRVKCRGNGGMSSAPADYCAKYCCKGEFASRVEDIEYGYIESAWTICSKSLGASLLDRMSDLYYPKQRKNELYYDYASRIVDGCVYVVSDGRSVFTYSLPSYYKRKLFCREVIKYKSVWSKTENCFLVRPFKVLKQSRLSHKMSTVLRDRAQQEYNRRYALVKSQNPSFSDSEVCLYLEIEDEDQCNYREAVALGKLHKFYKSNEMKHPKL